MTIVQTGSWPGWGGPVSVELADDAAVALFSAVAAYRSETGRHDADADPIVMPVGGKRSIAECEEMAAGFDLHRAGKPGWQAIYTKYNMDTASTARPSTTSPHVSGYCADIAPNSFLNWMIANGTRFGWRRTLVASKDLRHFQYFPGTATAALNVTSLSGSTTTTAKQEETDMTWARDTMVIRNSKTGGIVALEPFAINDWGGNLTALDNAGMSAGQPQGADGHYWINLDDTTYSVYLDQHRHHLDAFNALIAAHTGGAAVPVDTGAIMQALNNNEAAVLAAIKALPAANLDALKAALAS